MQPKECFYRDQFGYCWLEGEQWLFQPVDAHGEPLSEPARVDLHEIAFHHDEDEELH